MTETTPAALLQEALAAFQAELPKVSKNHTADMGARGKYKYADLKDVSEVVFPVLAKHGLAFTSMPDFTDSGVFVLHYLLTHKAGASFEGCYPLPNGKPQEIGSAITYARRYALCAITGVVSDDDDDGQLAQKAATVAVQKRAGSPVQVMKAPGGFYSRIQTADTLDALQMLWEEAGRGGFASAVEKDFAARGEALKK